MSDVNVENRNWEDIEMEEALKADDAKSQRKFLIKAVCHISNRLDNGITDEVEENTKHRKFVNKLFWVFLPIALGALGFLIKSVFV